MKQFTINSQTILDRKSDEVAEYLRVVEGPMTAEQVALTRAYITVEQARLDILEAMCDGAGFIGEDGGEGGGGEGGGGEGGGEGGGGA